MVLLVAYCWLFFICCIYTLLVLVLLQVLVLVLVLVQVLVLVVLVRTATGATLTVTVVTRLTTSNVVPVQYCTVTAIGMKVSGRTGEVVLVPLFYDSVCVT
jgi:hypothetical protein